MTPKKRGNGSHWTDKQIAGIRQWYGKVPIWALSKMLTRTRKAVYLKAHELGLSKRRQRRGEITAEQYETAMTGAAVAAGVPPRLMFRDLRGKQKFSAVKFAAWASIREGGVTVTSMARASGLNHTSIMYGLERHAEMTAREAAE